MSDFRLHNRTLCWCWMIEMFSPESVANLIQLVLLWNLTHLASRHFIDSLNLLSVVYDTNNFVTNIHAIFYHCSQTSVRQLHKVKSITCIIWWYTKLSCMGLLGWLSSHLPWLFTECHLWSPWDVECCDVCCVLVARPPSAPQLSQLSPLSLYIYISISLWWFIYLLFFFF